MPRDEQLEKLNDALLDPDARRRAVEDRRFYLDSLFTSFEEFPPSPPPFLIDGLLPLGYLTILAGDPKSGKTALASAIALAVAQGLPFAGMKTAESPVLWLSLEESRRERAAVLFPVVLQHAPEDPRRIGSLDSGPKIPIYTCHGGIAIDTEEGIEVLDHWIDKTRAKLIVVDPLHAAHSGRSLQDGWSARKSLRMLKRLCSECGLTAIVLHHLTVRGKRRVAESAQITAIASMVMMLSHQQITSEAEPNSLEDGEPAQRPSRIITLRCSGRGEATNRTLHLASDSPLDYRLTDPPIEPKVEPRKLNRPRPIDELVVRVLNEGAHLAANDIAGKLGVNVNSVRNAIPRLVHSGQIRLIAVVSGTSIYGPPTDFAPLTIKTSDESSESSESSESR